MSRKVTDHFHSSLSTHHSSFSLLFQFFHFELANLDDAAEVVLLEGEMAVLWLLAWSTYSVEQIAVDGNQMRFPWTLRW